MTQYISKSALAADIEKRIKENEEHWKSPYGIEPLQCVLSVNEIDWLNAYHFDYRGLIPKGLAIEVTEENNPYKK